MITIRNRFTNEILKEVYAENLSDADLRGADLSDADLRGADLSKADLRGADLSDADLRGADLSKADLRGADLSKADLRGADLSETTGFTIPLVENLDAKILNRLDSDPVNTLEMGLWHTCETTHCRAGWAVVLAGEGGKSLEEQLDTNAAGALIYARSYPDLPVPDFFASNKDAMADMKKRAGITEDERN